ALPAGRRGRGPALPAGPRARAEEPLRHLAVRSALPRRAGLGPRHPRGGPGGHLPALPPPLGLVAGARSARPRGAGQQPRAGAARRRPVGTAVTGTPLARTCNTFYPL